MQRKVDFKEFKDTTLIDKRFAFHEDVEHMDLLFGGFNEQGDLISFISYSINEQEKMINLSYIEVIEKLQKFGELLLVQFMERIYISGYRVETMASTFEGNEFFKRMIKKNVLPVGTNVISLFPM